MIPHILLIEESTPIRIYQTKMCSVHWFYWPTTSLTTIQLLWQWHQSRISGEKETTLQHMGAGRTRLLHFALQVAAERVIKGPQKGANVRKRGRRDAAGANFVHIISTLPGHSQTLFQWLIFSSRHTLSCALNNKLDWKDFCIVSKADSVCSHLKVALGDNPFFIIFFTFLNQFFRRKNQIFWKKQIFWFFYFW